MTYTTIVAEHHLKSRWVVVERHSALDTKSAPWVLKVLQTKRFFNEEQALSYVKEHYPKAAWTPGERPARNVAIELLKQR